MLVPLDRPLDLFAHVAEEAVGAERRVVPADLDDGGRLAAPALHPVPAGAAADHRADLDHVGLGDPVLAREQLALADHEHGVGVDAELAEDVVDLAAAGELDLPVGVAEPHLHAGQASAPPAAPEPRRPAPLDQASGPGSRPA
jgi:hypothetical protein